MHSMFTALSGVRAELNRLDHAAANIAQNRVANPRVQHREPNTTASTGDQVTFSAEGLSLSESEGGASADLAKPLVALTLARITVGFDMKTIQAQKEATKSLLDVVA